MNYLQTFEGFEGVKKTKKIKKHWRSDRGGVSSVMGSITNKNANLNDLMKKLVKRFKIEKVKYMNAGAFGMAFIADVDKIIKLTSNRDEAAEAKDLIDVHFVRGTDKVNSKTDAEEFFTLNGENNVQLILNQDSQMQVE